MNKLNKFQKFEGKKMNLSKVNGGEVAGMTWIGKGGATFAIGKDSGSNSVDTIKSEVASGNY